MKIVLVGNYVRDGQHSMARFATLLYSGLRARGHDVSLISQLPYAGKIGHPHRGIGKWLGYVDKYLLFPRQLKAVTDGAQVVHICDHSNAIYTRYLSRFRTIVTCHDLLAVRLARGELAGMRQKWTGKVYQKMVLAGLRRAHRIVCDSQTTESDLLRIARIPPERVAVVYVGTEFSNRFTNNAARADRLRQLGIGFEERFFLHVGVGAWYKNQSGLLKIFARLTTDATMANIRLVMVCDGVTTALRKLIDELQLNGLVHPLTNVSDEDLYALYTTAQALLYPSLHEGFGWPIIEAQACGCPVFTSNRSPMTEIGGDAAVYLDPENPAEAADTILENLPHAARIREAGFVNARRFSAQSMIAGYLEAYSDALSSTPIPSPAKAAAVRQSL